MRPQVTAFTPHHSHSLLWVWQEGELVPGSYLAKCRDILGFIASCVGITGTSLVEARYAAQGIQPGAL